MMPKTFLPRFIYCNTPKLVKVDDSFIKPAIDEKKWDEIYQVFKKVMENRSGEIAVSTEGKKLLNDWYRQHQEQKKGLSFPEELYPFWRRLEGYLLKFALIFHIFKSASGEENTKEISITTIKEAISLLDYYKGQAFSVVKDLCQGRNSREIQGLLEIIKSLNGECSLREIQRKKSSWQGKTEELKTILKQMEREGLISITEYTASNKSRWKIILLKTL